MTRASTVSAIRGGIIAAGEGSRLRADGFRVSKPMVQIGGRPLIDHALDRLRAAGIRKVTVGINEASDDCRQWLKAHAGDFDLDMIVRSTPSSYATFRLVADRLVDAPAVVTTVDAILPVDQFRIFVTSASRLPDDAVVLGVTGGLLVLFLLAELLLRRLVGRGEFSGAVRVAIVGTVETDEVIDAVTVVEIGVASGAVPQPVEIACLEHVPSVRGKPPVLPCFAERVWRHAN